MDFRALLEPKKATKSKKEPMKPTNNASPLDHGHPPQTPTNGGSVNRLLPTNKPTTPPTAIRIYDPRALLNPRGAKPVVKATKMSSDGQNGHVIGFENGAHGEIQHSVNTGFHFLENLHGAERRVEQRPVKRVKVDHATDNQAQQNGHAKGNPRHGNAGVGEYFKPKPVPTNGTTAGPPPSIDLTNDDEESDDGIEITGVRNLDDQEVCYGMINGSILAHKTPKPEKSNASRFATNQWPIFKVQLQRDKGRGNTINTIDPHNMHFGTVEQKLAEPLAPAMDGFGNSGLRTTCRVMSRPHKVGEWVHQPCSDKLRVIILVYGRRRYVEAIGKHFGQHNVWFQNPMTAEPGIPIMNPHGTKKINHIQPSSGRHVASTVRTDEEATDAVSKLFDYQAAKDNDYQPTEAPSTIITPLLPHQKQALTFMLRQESPRSYDTEESGNSSLWRKKIDHRGRVRYEEVVTSLTVDEEPIETFGGLLADVMGLGKTIQALSLIASTAETAVAFGQERLIKHKNDEINLVTQSRATLLVVPLSTVKNWEDQIKEHTSVGSMVFNIYHGPNRQKNPFILADNDVVITTYGTAGTEIAGRGKDTYQDGVSPLAKIKWFRIILDEAHTIRESKSSQARAMFSLHAQRRWCLTGTPIQNRMEDLGSLTTFLKLYPYDSSASFNQYITAPIKAGDTGVLKRLRVFVDSFTLRRLRDRISLPDRQDMNVKLKFSTEEEKLHDFFREKFTVAIKEMANDKKEKRATGSTYHRVLQGITILRLICDHGQELLKPEQLEEFKKNQPGEPIDLDEPQHLQGISKAAAHEHYQQMVDSDNDNCFGCDKKLTGDSPTHELEDKDHVQAFVTSCRCVLCPDCFAPHRAHYEAMKDSPEGIECVSCQLQVAPQFFTITKGNVEEDEKDEAIAKNTMFKNGFYSGPHTKTKELLADITEMKRDSAPLVAKGQPPLKCVVFSEFTSHLDLIQQVLSDNGLTFVRIDGSMSLAHRRKVLDALNNDNDVTILLASIKAAGQGLNLTAASRAFIMEPMWNPAAEAQAVDRIYRIGQKRDVVVKRYRMANSIEDKIVDLQDKKKKLAEMSMEKQAMQKALSKKERNEQSLKAMLDIFKAA